MCVCPICSQALGNRPRLSLGCVGPLRIITNHSHMPTVNIQSVLRVMDLFNKAS